jgi:hypothetical protein
MLYFECQFRLARYLGICNKKVDASVVLSEVVSFDAQLTEKEKVCPCGGFFRWRTYS